MLPDRVLSVLAEQEGVVSRQQLLALRAAPHDIKRWRRRRDLVTIHQGVYVDHTGAPTWLQRAWAAVLACEPAALWGPSALHAEDGAGDERATIEVAVNLDRRVVAPTGVHVVRRVRFAERVLWVRRPPRQRYDDALVDMALAATSPTRAIALLSGAVQSRRTTADRLRANLVDRPRAGPSRDGLAAVLADIAGGATSVLEHAYLEKVERAHGLPASTRQVAVEGVAGRTYRDVAYDGLFVELDSRTFHDNARQRDADFERDLDAAVSGADTRRLTYGQVLDRPCSTAGKIARLLVRNGWSGRPRPCGPTCQALVAFGDDW